MLSGFKNFLVTFLSAAILFGLVGYFTTRYVSGIVTGILDGEKDKTGETVTPGQSGNSGGNGSQSDGDLQTPDGESFTFIVVGTDYQPDLYDDYFPGADGIVNMAEDIKDAKDSMGFLSKKFRYIHATSLTIVRVDKENREFAVCYLSPETRIEALNGTFSIGDIYGQFGINELCNYITAITGLNINYHFVIDAANMKSFLEAFGSVSFSLSKDIYASSEYHVSASTSVVTETSKGGAETEKTVENVPVLKAGDQSLSDYSINILNTFKEYTHSDMEAKGAYTVDIIKQYLTRISEWSADELKQKISDTTGNTKYVSDNPYDSKPILATNFTADDAELVHSMLGAISYFNFNKLTYPGYYTENTSNDPGYYTVDAEAGLEMFKKYS